MFHAHGNSLGYGINTILTVFEVRTDKYWTEAKAFGPSSRVLNDTKDAISALDNLYGTPS